MTPETTTTYRHPRFRRTVEITACGRWKWWLKPRLIELVDVEDPNPLPSIPPNYSGFHVYGSFQRAQRKAEKWIAEADRKANQRPIIVGGDQ